MLGLTIGDVIQVVLTSIFGGAVLNKWILEKFHNHNVEKLAFSFILLIILSCLTLAANHNPIHKLLAIYLTIVCGGILMGIIFDLAVDKYVGHNKSIPMIK